MRDLVLGIRRLRATPGFAIFSIVTLALGIGITTAIFSIVRAVLAPPPGVTTIERLVTINHVRGGGSLPIIALSYGDFLDLRARQQSFHDVAGWALNRLSYTARGKSGTSFGELVSGEYFQVLGVRPAVGRLLQPADDTPSAPAVVVISHALWQRVFDGAPEAVGETIRLNGANFEIAGVAAPDFAGLFNGGLIASAAWIPMNAARLLPQAGTAVSLDVAARSRRWVQVRARLKSDVTLEQAQAEVTSIAQQLDREAKIGTDLPTLPRGRWPEYQTSRPWAVSRTADVFINESADQMIRPMAAVLMGAVGLVLLVACTNLANLMLARHSRRRTEAGVRLALGASRPRLVREALSESFVLAIAGGAAGVGVAKVLLVLLGQDLQVAGDVSLHIAPRLDLTVLGATAAAAVLALVVSGVHPALRAGRVDLRSALASEGAGASPRWRGRRYLIALQVTVSVMLVAVAGLCLATVRAQQQIETGVDLDRLAFADVDFAAQQVPEERVAQIVRAAIDYLATHRLPAAVSSGLPFGIGTPGAGVGGGDTPAPRGRFQLVAATPAIFEVLGVPILQGRAFTADDTATTAPVAVIDERTAADLFGTMTSIGRTITFQRTRWAGESTHPLKHLTVVGVARDTDAGAIGRREDGVVYLPLSQHYEGHLVFTARSADDPDAAAATLRRVISTVDPSLGIRQVGTGETFLGELTLFFRTVAVISSVLGTLALVVALAGLFGVLSHVVASRTRELGIRLALGAGPRRIVGMVLREGLSPVLLGILAGTGLAVLARFAIQPGFARLLPPLDGAVLVSVALLFIAAGTGACYLPARRAASVDPASTLRAQ